ncbi:hypothetical protein [Saccharibacillus alkalitolerans]|uniref:Rha family transcriptional regulator n=1 Tax=Saccharibacillus alkalitolerans TaxID=2705290 RepID=A0ABX0F4Y5_9BACL|nr:hypothetical protein [Saccharibacillus alkalitolerans]NGZ76021.1 hypothetical protein [Saccharibacillus alkalitolerans]
MQRKKPITPFGWEIKRRLAELEMDQKTFCELHDIPPSRLSNLINGSRKAARYRKQVSDLLGLSEQPEARSHVPADSGEYPGLLKAAGTRR